MKATRLTVLLLIISYLLGYYEHVSAQDIPNMIRLDKTGVYIDKTEVTIRGWHEYVWYMYKTYGENSEQFLATKCDSAVFRNQYNHVFLYPYTQGLGMMEKHGFTSDDIRFMNEEYDKQPMVGLTYEQCLAFCRWRTEMHNKNHRQKVQFRLPTAEELHDALIHRKIRILFVGEDGEYISDSKTSSWGTFRCVATTICNQSIVGNWQYVKSTVSMAFDDHNRRLAFKDRNDIEPTRKGMTINGDGSMTMEAWNGKHHEHVMLFETYDLSWQQTNDSVFVKSPSGGSESWKIDQLTDGTLVYTVVKPFTCSLGAGTYTYTYTYRRK